MNEFTPWNHICKFLCYEAISDTFRREDQESNSQVFTKTLHIPAHIPF